MFVDISSNAGNLRFYLCKIHEFLKVEEILIIFALFASEEAQIHRDYTLVNILQLINGRAGIYCSFF